MKVHIDLYNKDKTKDVVKVSFIAKDFWNLDITLAKVIAPALKKMKKFKGGIPPVEDKWVPKELRKQEKTKNAYAYDNMEERWDWVMDEMIYTFESIATDGVDSYDKGNKRILNGLKLFGAFYPSLWN